MTSVSTRWRRLGFDRYEARMSTTDPSADKKYLDALIRDIQDTRRLFSNTHKTEREKMICRAFLRCVGVVDFTENDLCIGPHEPIDIAFADAAFQITEVLDEGRRRTLENRERETKYQEARPQQMSWNRGEIRNQWNFQIW
jgi:hypothetical protein